MRQWNGNDAYINDICVNNSYIGAYITKKRAETARKGALMANRMDWIPTQEAKLVDLMATWQTKLVDGALQTAYVWPADECTLTKAGMTAFTEARTAYQAAPTTANRAEKDELKKAAIEGMRKFARGRVRNNGKMNDGQKRELGVRVSDKEPSPAPVPDAGLAMKPRKKAH
jgi:hypothetical protein